MRRNSARALARSLGVALAAGCAGAQRGGGDIAGARAPYTAAELARVVGMGEVAIAPDGREVAFTTDRTGAFELWTMAIARGRDGGWTTQPPRQRTRAGEYVAGLVYSPDSATLVFEMDHGGDERTDLWIVRRGDGEPERLTQTTTAEHGVRFAPDGRSIAFQSDTDRPFRFNVYTMDLATRVVTQRTREPVNVQGPRFVGDGRALAATRTGDDQRGELVIVDLTTGSTRTVAPPLAGGIAWGVAALPSGALLTTATTARW